MIWFEDIIKAAEQAGSCEIFPILRRPDEEFVTKEMFANAQVGDCWSEYKRI